MNNAKSTSHSFLIRLWIEGVSDDLGTIQWRGHITHLIDEDRRYVETFDQIISFVQGYLGISAGPGSGSQAAGPPRGHE